MYAKITMVSFLVADLLLSTVLPFLFALSGSFVKIFLMDRRADSLMDSIHHIHPDYEETVDNDKLNLFIRGGSVISGTKMKP